MYRKHPNPLQSSNCKQHCCNFIIWAVIISANSFLYKIFSLWRTHSIQFWVVVIPSPIGEAGSRPVSGDQSNERGHKTKVLRSTLKQCNNLEPSTSWPKIIHEFQDDLTKRIFFFFLWQNWCISTENTNFALTTDVCQIISTEEFPTNANHQSLENVHQNVLCFSVHLQSINRLIWNKRSPYTVGKTKAPSKLNDCQECSLKRTSEWHQDMLFCTNLGRISFNCEESLCCMVHLTLYHCFAMFRAT